MRDILVTPPALDIRNLSVSFPSSRGQLHVIRNCSLTIDSGESVGLVGESGCGKTTLGLAAMRLLPQSAQMSGSVFVDGSDINSLGAEACRTLRGNRIGMIFQDPLSALNPYLRIGSQIVEPLRVHGLAHKKDALLRAQEKLTHLGLADVQKVLRSYPHELSGGMRQRIMIAMALITQPSLILADEPTTALDVTIQAQILDLLRVELGTAQQSKKTAMLFISHNLAVVASVCSRIDVMYAGTIIERAPAQVLVRKPLHPYTLALVGALPAGSRRGRTLSTIEGAPPDPANLPRGCPFAPRCAIALDACTQVIPDLTDASNGRMSACLRYKELL